MLRLFGLLAVMVFSMAWPLFTKMAAAQTHETFEPKVIIGAIKIDGGSADQYATIYNQASEAVDLGGWLIEYADPDFISLNCQSLSWALADKTNAKSVVLPFESIEPEQLLKINIGYTMNDSSGGSARIVDTASNVHDIVGWDNGTASRASCLDDLLARQPAPWAGDNQKIQRILDCHTNKLIDTDNNEADFVLSAENDDFTDNCPPEIPENSCVGINISELFPNPKGADINKEFIELHNPTGGLISLAGCSLQTSANSTLFTFTNENLPSGKYNAYFDSETALTLTNSSEGTVYLIDSNGIEVSQVNYPAGLRDDVSWALFAGGFFETFKPTPNTENQLLERLPCPAGQFRNPDTNRCKNIITEAANLTPCKPGQQRNPQTNRCRSVASLATVLKPCASDQFRNPGTNRCKKSASNGFKPCAKGQERNPETNRCRNAAGVLNGNDQDLVQDIAAPPGSSQGVILAIGSVIGAMAYGLWEWRNEAILGFLNLKKKFFGPA